MTGQTDSAGEAIRIRGLVQGVGFRPTVWRLAQDCGLAGEVGNDADGVFIRIWGAAAARQRFLHRIRREAPPLARIDALEVMPLDDIPPPDCGAKRFRIVASRAGDVHTGIVPDAAVCGACLAEVDDPTDRRHGYAFTNCTHCGPRLSIVVRIPYDRAHTSMAAFALCDTCRAEYDNPADRRFHAQPNACADCGPRLWLEMADAAGPRHAPHADPIVAAQQLLKAGQIVAVKGIGGVHLACDASNETAVARLRQRKHRYDKPFALMARATAAIRRYCRVGEDQARLLQSPAAPIVLLDCHGQERLAASIAPQQCTYGFMLAYTPLHHLLLAGLDHPIVLTSGNRSDEPQSTGNDEARQRLSGIADAWLLHDRDIVNRLDDSVTRVIAGRPAILRRARGYAPAPLRLPPSFAAAPPVLAFGGELKNSFCLLRDGEAIVSQHLGDLENAAANNAYRQTLDLYQRLFQHHATVLAIDSHPGYLPSQIGRDRSANQGQTLVSVQHHHAHIAACLADNGMPLGTAPVLGIALDGTGFGDDGTVWGGEFLLADYRGYRRLGSVASVAMPGAAQAVRQPWRMAYAHLRRLGNWPQLQADCAGLPFFSALAQQPLATLDGMLVSGFNSPMTTSCGRLFDAVAAVLGLRQTVSYEGQAAIELEAIIQPRALTDDDGYPFAIESQDGLPRLEPGLMWRALLADLRAGVTPGVVSARFHNGLADAVLQMVQNINMGPVCERVALSGGVFQNAAFSQALIKRLESTGLEVLRHRQVPANDGGLSLGQAVVAAAHALASEPQSAMRANFKDKQTNRAALTTD